MQFVALLEILNLLSQRVLMMNGGCVDYVGCNVDDVAWCGMWMCDKKLMVTLKVVK